MRSSTTLVEQPWSMPPSKRNRSLTLSIKAATSVTVPAPALYARGEATGWIKTASGIDDQITQLQSTLNHLRRWRNTVIPIAGLPTELLLTIFRLCVPGLDDGAPHWHAFSQVCHHWRNVALAIPDLWRRIDCTRRQSMTSTLLSRSCRTPLILLADLATQESREQPAPVGLIDALRHAPRLSALKLVLPRHVFDSGLRMRLGAPAPLLETCDITVSGPDGLRFPYAQLFADCAPRLRHLRLAGCAAEWGSSLFSGLRALSLAGVPRYCLPLWEELFGILDRCPLLEELALDGVLDALPPNRVLPREAVQLSSLRSLSMRDAWARCATLLRNVRFPARTQVSVRPTQLWNLEYGGGFCAALAEHYSRHAAPPSSRMLIRHLRWNDRLHDIDVQGWSDARILPAAKPLFNLCFTRTDDFNALAFVAAFGSTLEAVRTLDVSQHCAALLSHEHISDWTRAAPLLANIETIVARGAAAGRLAFALSSNMFPCLQEIRITGDVLPAGFIVMLAHMLIAQPHYGLRLERICLPRGALSPPDILLLNRQLRVGLDLFIDETL